jgi:Ca-activated chloride channel family protein
VFLLSDGKANIGDTDPTVIAGKVRDACASGIKVSTFGLGADYNEELMEQIAVAGQGGYHFLETPDSAPNAFEAELAELFATSARDVRITLQPHAKGRITRLLGLDATESPIEVGNVPAEATRTVLAEVEIDAKRSQEYALLTAELSYRDPTSDRTISGAQQVMVRLTKDEQLIEDGIDTSVLARVAELQAAEAQQQAAALADAGNFAGAGAVLRDSSVHLAALSSQAPAEVGNMLRYKAEELTADLELVAGSASYDKIAAKRIKARSYLTRSSRTGQHNQHNDNSNHTPQP